MAFIGVSDFSAEGGANNYVHGDQIINSTTHIVQKQEKKRTIYDEFYDIRHGAIRRLRDIHREDYPRQLDVGIRRRQWEKGRLRVNRTICAAEIRGEQGSKLTVVSYSGPEKEKAWKKDFRQFSKAMDATKVQLFRINRSNIHLLIFYGELVPLANFWGKLGLLARSTTVTLASRMKCRTSQLWMDPQQGKLICGPEGPGGDRMHPFSFWTDETPSSAEVILEDNVCFHYYSHLPLETYYDRCVIIVFHSGSMMREKMPLTVNQPYIKTNSMVMAVGNAEWRSRIQSLGLHSSPLDFHSRVLMLDGRTRFTLQKDYKVSSFQLACNQTTDECVWLSQASSVFHKHGTSLQDDLSSYKLILPNLKLRCSFKHSRVKHQRHLEGPPIHLFLHPLPFSPPLKEGLVTPIHTWSFDENGQTPIPHDYCKYLGLATKLWVKARSHSYSWPTETYDAIHKWQVARGFDPTTTDFACYLGFPIYEVISSESLRLEELGLGSPVMENPPHKDRQQSTISSIRSTLTAPFAYTVDDDSEISVALM